MPPRRRTTSPNSLVNAHALVVQLVVQAALVHCQSASEEVAHETSKCSEKRFADQLVVTARKSEDVSWLIVHLDTPVIVYQAEDAATDQYSVHRHSNVAREASAYLKFIVEYYKCLPEVTAFVHAHQRSWHADDTLDLLQKLQWGNVTRYTPLHFGFWEEYGPMFESFPGQPEKHLNPLDQKEERTLSPVANSYGVVDGLRVTKADEYHFLQARHVSEAWHDFFGPAGFGALPEVIKYFCCAQFVVPRASIQAHPHSFYLEALEWMENSVAKAEIRHAAQYSMGVVFETVWHIIFGEDSVLARPSNSTRCQIFRC